MKQIVYVGSYNFPMGDAVAKRVLGIGKVLTSAGYRVSYIGENVAVKNGNISEEKQYEGFRYCSLHKPVTSKEHYQYRADIKCVEKKLKKWAEEGEISAVLFCGTKCSLFANQLVKVCKKMNIPTIADSMDWLEIRTGNILFDLIKQTDIIYELCYVNKKADGVIAISRYLSDYYSKRGMNTVVIPPVSPYERAGTNTRINEKITLVYAGIPCRLGKPLKNRSDAKDRLDIAIDLVYEAFFAGCSFIFRIYGLTKDQYCTVFPEQQKIISVLVAAGIVKFMGYAKENIVRDAIRSADFTVLLREKNRTSEAGFPTKISESITLGTPVITTETSDVTTYLKEGIDGFFLNIADLYVAKNKFIEILQLEVEKRINMKRNVINNKSFEFSTYVERLKTFLSLVERDVSVMKGENNGKL